MKKQRRCSPLEALKPTNFRQRFVQIETNTLRKVNQYFGVGSNWQSRTRMDQWAMEAVKQCLQVPDSLHCHSLPSRWPHSRVRWFPATNMFVSVMFQMQSEKTGHVQWPLNRSSKLPAVWVTSDPVPGTRENAMSWIKLRL